MTHSPQQLREILDRHGLEPRRRLGQNFVIDPNTVRRIAKLSGASPGDPIVEIGAGLGSLTLALAETGAEVTAVEVDGDLARALRDVVADHDVRVVQADARTLDWAGLLAGRDDWRLVANLPYNIAASLIVDLLGNVAALGSMLVMVQREVGERLAAKPGDKAVGIPSLLVAYHGTAKVVGRVPATVFYPKPKVESVLVRIDRHTAPPVDQPLEAIEILVRAGFSQRRKMLRRSLAGFVDSAGFALAGLDSRARPETLSLTDWSRLAAVADISATTSC
ncbi:MAG: 16S rRNA (adenine(1518)-N(6)/adenine(1519)-N(6))-dimethyltransferase RsmA [Acidimicrobiaceae bacterium]|nr:16S rRNA (adenine(1518)-N(6)/adenine(1519)-N(6))-dimethyltransferase RsmA [Acidimicrobiaceae bacterium]MXW76066.1 16S rRNA (adenine(1518)-N(6)/adenine(1519)-N(6))-dimethyltransferase RsmA [Acidimicrobiaceae bacterium]MYC43245.1 16S rRNA (adenine(1518)-N(6)/adenine(1519)-N(6))-dimethyltransferase RsmA [Acidimicrobiaceae bacterium]MYD06207.1 16S rRNA (adenine(1518)-N(6)/adenine(1519)-N(6))-dimethyltransferase RsmA [Acidimicrobiaceae bacterium]MYH87921.1 16S rRNA (adenine(1518)-N(6)/adenine(151